MKPFLTIAMIMVTALAISCRKPAESNVQSFQVKGVVEELRPDGKTVVIKHEAIPNYMEAMTMPFQVKEARELMGIHPGDEVSFLLWVTSEVSWIDHLTRSGKTIAPQVNSTPTQGETNSTPSFRITDIPDFALTNELGQPTSLHQFKGKAIALTFFFTRCPIPDYCPRLAKNFEGTAQKLNAMTNGPTNWQLLSISFDPRDRPEILKAYGQHYHYDPAHWSFLTGNPDHIRELSRGFGITATNDGFFYNHNFATAIFDAAGHLQTLWRFGGDTTDILVKEIVKAAAVSNN